MLGFEGRHTLFSKHREPSEFSELDCHRYRYLCLKHSSENLTEECMHCKTEDGLGRRYSGPERIGPEVGR